MTALWLLIAVVAATVMLAAMAVAGSRVSAWQRPAAPSLEDLICAAGKRYRLDASQRETVRHAVRRGEAGPADLRAAIFDVASELKATLAPPDLSTRQRVVLAAGSGALLGGWLVVHLVRHQYSAGFEPVVEALIIGGVIGLLFRSKRRRAQRAVSLNQPRKASLPGPVVSEYTVK